MKYSDLLDEHTSLATMGRQDMSDGCVGEDPYWAAREAFRANLSQALSNDSFILSLDAKQLIQFIAWCSSFRPREPISILTKLSSLAENLKKGE